MTRLINLFYALRTVQFNGQLGATLTIALGVEMVMVAAFHTLTSVSGDLWRLEGWYWRVHALYWLGASTQQIVAVSDASQAHTWTLGALMRSPFIELGHTRFWRQFVPALELAVGVGLLTMMSFVIIMIRLGVTASRDRLIRGGNRYHQPSWSARCTVVPARLPAHHFAWEDLMYCIPISSASMCALKAQQAAENRY